MNTRPNPCVTAASAEGSLVPRDLARRQWLTTRLILLVSCIAAATSALGQTPQPAITPPVVDNAMWQDPFLPLPRYEAKYSPTLVPMWLQALDRPDAETRRVAAGTFAVAAKRGMPGLEPAIEPLRGILRDDTDPVVRRAAAAALVALDARATTDDLAAAAAHDGLLMQQLVEPALARWDHQAARGVWRARLTDPRCEPSLLRLAIDALATVADDDSVEPLLLRVLDDAEAIDTRVAAAEACGLIRPSGLTSAAADLASRRLRPPHLGPLLAVRLLARHDDQPSIEQLTSLVATAEPAVASAAFARLRDIDNDLALPFARGAITSPDAGLRRVGADVLIAQGDAAAIDALCPLLDDRNPSIRGQVAGALVVFAADEQLHASVIDGTTAVLGRTGWRGLEQASLVLGTLDHEPAAERLMELIRNERPEVAVASTWALRKLSVDATLAPLLSFAEASHEAMVASVAPRHVGLQVSQIFQYFGEVLYEPGDPLMRKFVPKSTLLPDARGAACWALGHLEAAAPSEALAEAFAGRLADVGSPNPENDLVRTMTAISLGRMKAEPQLATLREFGDRHGPIDTVGLACLWAVEQITGEPMETIETLTYGVAGWFLQPELR